jgi:hypothetical protein
MLFPKYIFLFTNDKKEESEELKEFWRPQADELRTIIASESESLDL